jgi:hypothetical protein
MPATVLPALGHFAIEALFADLLVAIEGRSRADLEPLWTEFERALTEHFALEERTVLADLLAARPREARIFLEEHRYLRGRLAHLGATLPDVPVETARTFFDELRAHGQHEERVLARWAESSSFLSSTRKSSRTDP